MSKTIGIIDEPVQPGAQDKLDINIHSQALIEFIEKSNTPITIGIQGEWGSGKTSLLNTIYHHFESKSDFKQIWINSWESSLLSTPEESVHFLVSSCPSINNLEPFLTYCSIKFIRFSMSELKLPDKKLIEKLILFNLIKVSNDGILPDN